MMVNELIKVTSCKSIMVNDFNDDYIVRLIVVNDN